VLQKIHDARIGVQYRQSVCISMVIGLRSRRSVRRWWRSKTGPCRCRSPAY